MHFLLSHFTSLKVIIFYFLLSKQICLCTAIGFAAFSCHNAQLVEKNMLIFAKKDQNHKIPAHCVKNTKDILQLCIAMCLRKK